MLQARVDSGRGVEVNYIIKELTTPNKAILRYNGTAGKKTADHAIEHTANSFDVAVFEGKGAGIKGFRCDIKAACTGRRA